MQFLILRMKQNYRFFNISALLYVAVLRCNTHLSLLGRIYSWAILRELYLKRGKVRILRLVGTCGYTLSE